MSIEIACAAHGAYVPRSAAMLHSALSHAGPSGARVHYLHAPDLSRRVRLRLEAMVAETGGTIAFHPIAPERVAGLPVLGGFTEAMWYRILLPELVEEADRVLYLDVDTLVLDALDDLWATDLVGAPVAAVTNVLQPDHRFHVADLGLRAEDYFNSGVLLLSLEALRLQNAAAALRDAALARAGQRGWPDQDALNLVLGHRRVALHPRWNAMNVLWDLAAEADAAFGAQTAAEAREHPAIRHFEGPAANKPWSRSYRRPDREEWRAHQRATPWPRGRYGLTAIRPV